MSKTCKDQLPVNYNFWCKTEFEKSDTFTFVWSISDFASRTENVIECNDFYIKGPGGASYWSAKVYPNGMKEEEIGYVSVIFSNEETPFPIVSPFPDDEVEYEVFEVQVDCVLSSLDVNNIKNKLGEFNTKMGNLATQSFLKIIDRKNISQIAPTGTLILVFDIQIMDKITKPVLASVHGNVSATSVEYHHKQLSQDLELSYAMKEFADITITCEGRNFKCHKLILASRSPFFKTMFETDMKEKNTGKYEIKFMNVEVFEDLLKYMYSGVAPNINSTAKELFEAADRCQLSKLRDLCEVTLCSQIEVSNCIELLLLGDLFQTSTLKRLALNFVSNHLKKIGASEWKKKLMSTPSLLIEVTEMVMRDKQLPFCYDIWCKTDFEEGEKFTYVWEMPDFDSKTATVVNGFLTESIQFNVRGNVTGQHYCCVTLAAKVYPNGFSLEEEGYVSVFLDDEERDKYYYYQFDDMNVKCVVSSLDVVNAKQKLGEFVKNMRHKGRHGWPKLIKRENLSHIAPSGTLTLIFDVEIVGKSITTANEGLKTEVSSESFHHQQLIHDLDLCLSTQEYTDVTLSCGEKEFQCHKLILASRSPVFKTMFEEVMKRKESGKIEIKDEKVEVIEEVLKYIYTGTAPNIDTLGKDLFKAADQYQLENLKEMCELKLRSRINGGNCIDLLIFSDTNKVSSLKNVALNYMAKNLKMIEASEWKKKLKDSPSLLVEVIEKRLQNRDEDCEGSSEKRAKYF